MPSYETLCIFNPGLPEARVKELTAWTQKIVENGQGTIVKVEEWGMRDLAYRLKKQTRGYYVLLAYDSQPPVVKELERNLRLNEDVLRFFSIVHKAPTPEKAPAPPPAPVVAPTPEPASEEQ
jgi:small subunit ribosomal protein S6